MTAEIARLILVGAGWLYVASLAGLLVLGAAMAVHLVLAVWLRRPRPAAPAPAAEAWPAVLVQLPLYNERFVVERLIDAAAALDYPRDRLQIQVLDDSSDDTPARARARVAYHRARGVPLTYLRRPDRAGFKAGALATGLAAAPAADLVAVFDADFAPAPDFLRRLAPDFLADPRLGMVQARWEHLNPDQNALTRAQALAFDSFFAVEQVARSRAGWPMNFNGSAGVWRRTCIEAAGGWQADTLAEDADLSYRALLAGWRLDYRPEVAVPAELTPTLLAFKRQQFRWAKGSFQVLGKLAGRLWRAPWPAGHKLLATLNLAGYAAQPLALALLLLSLPVVLAHGRLPVAVDGLSWLGLVPPLTILWGQVRFRPEPLRRLLFFPVLTLTALGLALNNTVALAEALAGRAGEFQRTPKGPASPLYAVPLDWTTAGELLLALYAFAGGGLALERAPHMAVMLFVYALGFGGVAAVGLWEAAAHHPQAEPAQ